jgi:hypothetical protein
MDGRHGGTVRETGFEAARIDTAAALPRLLIALLMIATVREAGAQPRDTANLDAYYRHVLSVGLEYDSLSPPNEFATGYRSYGVSGVVRYPLPFLPILQPLFRGGIYQFSATEQGDAARWDNLHWYGALGAGLYHKFSKSFELGGELCTGFSEAIFRNLGPDPGDIWGAPHFLAQLAGVISFNPSFNLSLSAVPSVRYMRSFTDFTRLNGLTFAIGFSASYRFGEDPDAPQAIVRAVSLDKPEIPPVFAAMQSYYVDHPIGTGTIRNIEKYPIYDVSISFFQKDFMDSPTKVASIPEVRPGESKAFDITAAFNDRIFTVVGQTPLNASLTVDYIMRNKAATQSFTAGYNLHDKTALTWDDLRKVAAFITPADSALRNYTSFIRQGGKNDLVPSLSAELQTAMQIYAGLTALGCLYQSDPKSPFAYAQGNPVAIDSISIPRDTLKRITGDCDDLTVLYCSLLETAGVDTAYITTPGHIFAAFNTKVAPQNYRDLHPDRSLMLLLNNELWIPVEITMFGAADFLQAWRTGAEEYAEYEAEPDQRQITVTREAQEAYKPVVLTETDLGVQYGITRDTAVRGFTESAQRLVDTILADYTQVAKDSKNKKRYNTLGIKAAELGRLPMAEDAFNTALTMDRNYLAPQVNLGNVLFLKQDYQNALKVLHSAEELMRAQGEGGTLNHGKVLLSIARCYYELESFDKADEYSKKASAIDPSLGRTAQYLSRSTDGSRAARVEAPTASFVEDQE